MHKLPFTSLELKPELFRFGYYVYIVKIEIKGDVFYYIGQTGDRAHEMARSPFYRMSGHFNLQDSATDNQIYKALEKRKDKFNISDTKSLLGKTSCKYFMWLIHPFDISINRVKGVISEDHKEKRRETEMIENGLIKLMRKEYGEQSILNINFSDKNEYDGDLDNVIFKEFKERNV